MPRMTAKALGNPHVRLWARNPLDVVQHLCTPTTAPPMNHSQTASSIPYEPQLTKDDHARSQPAHWQQHARDQDLH